MSNGVKHDSDKPDMSLLSPFALEEIAKVMTFGAKKYSANNWRQGFKYTRILAAVLRHLMAYQRGEAKDPETGLSHLAHASCGLMMLLEFEKTGAGENDVYWQSKPLQLSTSEQAKKQRTKFEQGQLVRHIIAPVTALLVEQVMVNNNVAWRVSTATGDDTWLEQDFILA